MSICDDEYCCEQPETAPEPRAPQPTELWQCVQCKRSKEWPQGRIWNCDCGAMNWRLIHSASAPSAAEPPRRLPLDSKEWTEDEARRMGIPILGRNKPDPEIFKKALNDLEQKIEQAKAEREARAETSPRNPYGHKLINPADRECSPCSEDCPACDWESKQRVAKMPKIFRCLECQKDYYLPNYGVNEAPCPHWNEREQGADAETPIVYYVSGRGHVVTHEVVVGCDKKCYERPATQEEIDKARATNRLIDTRKNIGPCSACGDGDTEQKYHKHDQIEGKSEMIKKEKPRLAVGVSVLVTDPTNKKLLLGERINNTAAGMFSTPGGRVELNEGYLDCAVRELLEETGLSVKRDDLQVVTVQEHFRFGDHYIMFYIHAGMVYGKLENKEPDKCKEWLWFDLDKLPENCTEPAVVIEELLNHLRGNSSLDHRNFGASITARKLKVIAETGTHSGVFGGKDIEETAQAIVKIHRHKNMLIEELDTANKALAFQAKEMAKLGNELEALRKDRR